MRKLLGVAAWLLLASGMGWAEEGERPRLIVGFRAEVSGEDREALLSAEGLRMVEDIGELGLAVAEAAPEEALRPVALKVAAREGVLHVEEDFEEDWLQEAAAGFAQLPLPGLREVMGQLPTFTPRDQTQGEIPWGIQRVGAADAWERTQGQGVRIAVVDTGVDCRHPDLAPNCAGGYNAVDSGSAQRDGHGHGTHVAGTIAGAKNGTGVVGVAPSASVFAVKVLDDKGRGRLTSIIKGLIWCGRNGVQVANMSLGSPRSSLFMRLAVDYARSRGVTIVAAAGNSGGQVSYPGAFGGVIAVSALDSRNQLAGFSSRGKQVAFAAPGVDVLSTIPGGGYGRKSGTSMAAPHVAGLAALAITQGAGSPDAVLAALRAASEPVAGLRPEEQGAGVIGAGRLLR